MARLKALFYGDDFTGSSENLAQYHRSGARSKLYLAPPTVEELRSDAETYDVLGLAGTARALGPQEMAAELEEAYGTLSVVECNLVQYKICSTFDSSSTVGSFGIALDVAAKHFELGVLSVLAATPDFGRYTCFGNHFARFGSDVPRLDRHPSMRAHPRTPMQEADLRMHLASQTDRPFQNLYVTELHKEGLAHRIQVAAANGCGVILDGVTNADVAEAARAIWELSQSKPSFSLSAQGLAQHLGYLWAKLGLIPGSQAVVTDIPSVDRLLVLSGSCALQNGRQIEVVESAGWASIHLDPALLSDDRAAKVAAVDVAPRILESLASGRSAVVFTAKGVSGRMDADDVPADRLGSVYAELIRRIRSELPLRRVVLAGGDSSSYAVRHSGAKSLEIAVFDSEQNSHVCRLSASNQAAVDGLEVMLKGGQVGNDDYFLRALAGTGAANRTVGWTK